MTDRLREAIDAALRVLDNEGMHNTADDLRAALAEPEPEPVAPFRFTRYVHGHEMAEGVTIEGAKTLQEAMRMAAGICPPRVGTVLVYTHPITPPAAEPLAWECKAGGLKPLSQRLYESQPDNIKRHYTRITPPASPDEKVTWSMETLARAQTFLNWNRAQRDNAPVRIGAEYAVYEEAIAIATSIEGAGKTQVPSPDTITVRLTREQHGNLVLATKCASLEHNLCDEETIELLALLGDWPAQDTTK